MAAAPLAGLRAFHAVAVAESFTRAARARRVSQPTLSAQVRALEGAYGVRLFDRVGRAVRLTALGQSLFVITTRLMAAEDEASDLLAGTKSLTRGHLRLAADSVSHVLAVLARFKAAHPGLTFSLTIGNSSDVLDQVANYAADVAVTAKQTSDPRIHATRLRTDRLVGFVPADHPWATRRSIPIGGRAGHRAARAGLGHPRGVRRPARRGRDPAGRAARSAVPRGRAGGGRGWLRPRHRVRRRVPLGRGVAQGRDHGRGSRGRRIRGLPGGAPAHPAGARFSRCARGRWGRRAGSDRAVTRS